MHASQCRSPLLGAAPSRHRSFRCISEPSQCSSSLFAASAPSRSLSPASRLAGLRRQLLVICARCAARNMMAAMAPSSFSDGSCCQQRRAPHCSLRARLPSRQRHRWGRLPAPWQCLQASSRAAKECQHSPSAHSSLRCRPSVLQWVALLILCVPLDPLLQAVIQGYEPMPGLEGKDYGKSRMT